MAWVDLRPARAAWRGRGAMEAQAARAATCTTSTDYSSAADTTAAMEYDEGTAASDSLVGEMTGESAAGQQSAGGRSKVAAAGVSGLRLGSPENLGPPHCRVCNDDAQDKRSRQHDAE